ncbi:glycosyltransferase family 1 protein [Mycobacterium sp. 1081908.1]|uniref:glycosyltransferase family 4 protein n=1 Tax=Mycobacterium sp. 1081908.1 TaxID=1834066 RepID=UPI0007FF019D|nr:glycosyltransferase family 1 protein [Mycobacterium sp. 1081908.1]OBK43404.1 glycosyl transferase family 1 [Mycobacterium sp. 1081908.1]
MKVAFDHQIFAQQRYGGVSRYFFELASRLPSDTVSDVSIIAPLYINSYLAVEPARATVRGRYVPYTSKSIARVVDVVNRFAVPVAWRGIDPDIVHETYFATKPVGKGRRRVVTVYDMIYELFADEFPDAEQVTAAKRAAVDRADHVICISETTRRDLVRLLGVDPARTSVVHLGYSMTTETGMTEADGGKPRSTLLYVGHRRGYKNFTTVLRAYASSAVLRDFELIAFGGNPPLPEEEEELARLGIAGRVRFESGSDGELAARYREAAAFVYPSRYEGFGIPPLEAMSHGCPVVCSNAGSIPEVVGDAGLYFEPDDVEQLRATLERVATTEGLQTELRTRGYARLTAFSWEKCATETARIYRSLS